MLSWFALNSKPNSERIVYDVLSARGIEAYLPLWHPPRRRDRARVARPYFPCYLFAHADIDQVGVSTLQYLPGVRRLVFCGDKPVTVPDAAIETIQARLEEMDQRPVDYDGNLLTPGDHVLITAGPLAGLEAVFDRALSSGDRVRLLINFLQRGMHLDIEWESIEKIATRESNH